MPSYSLGEIISQATYRVGRRSDLPASQVSFFVNESIMEIAALAPGALSEATAFLSLKSGSATTGLPADFAEPILFSLQSGGSHTTLAETARETIDSYGTASGQPTQYILYGTQMEVRPIPNSDWTCFLRYRQRPSDLTSTDSVPSLSTEWRLAVLYKTEEKLFNALGNYSGAQIAQQRYLSYVQSLPTDEGRRQKGDTPRGVRVYTY